MIKKAVIPMGGYGTRSLPFTQAVPKEMLPIINVPAIHYVVEEAINSGIEEILFVVNQQKKPLIDYFARNVELEKVLHEKKEFSKLENISKLQDKVRIKYLDQAAPGGSGASIRLAKNFVGNDFFAVLYADELFFNGNALAELINAHQKTGNSVIGVKKIPDEKKYLYGIVETKNDLVSKIIEKPKKHATKSNLANVGRYILSPNIFAKIKGEYQAGQEVYITDAFNELIKEENFSVCEIRATRYDIGNKTDYVKAIIDMAYDDSDLKKEIKEYMKTR